MRCGCHLYFFLPDRSHPSISFCPCLSLAILDIPVGGAIIMATAIPHHEYHIYSSLPNTQILCCMLSPILLFVNTDIESALLLKVPCIYRIAMMGDVFKGAAG